jgi:hypothetical protein
MAAANVREKVVVGRAATISQLLFGNEMTLADSIGLAEEKKPSIKGKFLNSKQNGQRRYSCDRTPSWSWP